MGLFIKQMLEIPTTNPRLPNSCGQTPAALAIHAWLDSQVKKVLQKYNNVIRAIQLR